MRLGSVHSAPFLRERIVWRASPVEYGLYEQRRWFELPSRYVRRALTATLQSTPGLRLGDEPTAARLDVEILAFDEILAPDPRGPRRASAPRCATARRSASTARSRRTCRSRRVDGAATAESIGHALDEVVKKVATATASVLGPKARPRAGAAAPGSVERGGVSAAARSRLKARIKLPAPARSHRAGAQDGAAILPLPSEGRNHLFRKRLDLSRGSTARTS